jgi:hypothetical protein
MLKRNDASKQSAVQNLHSLFNIHTTGQVVLKKNDTSKSKSAGRSKWSQKRELASDGGSSEHGSEASIDSALSAATTGTGSLAEQARAGECVSVAAALVCGYLCIYAHTRTHTHTHTHLQIGTLVEQELSVCFMSP